MFNKNKKSTEIRPANQSPKGKQDKNKNTRDNKDSKQEKSDMQSEGGQN